MGARGVRQARRDDGFTLVEIIVAIMILAFGVLGLASTTAYVVRQVTFGQMATQRAAALQTAIEQLRAVEWDDIAAGSQTIGRYSVNWWIYEDLTQSKVMKIATVGPGLTMAGGFPGLAPSVSDTFTYRLLRP